MMSRDERNELRRTKAREGRLRNEARTRIARRSDDEAKVNEMVEAGEVATVAAQDAWGAIEDIRRAIGLALIDVDGAKLGRESRQLNGIVAALDKAQEVAATLID